LVQSNFAGRLTVLGVDASPTALLGPSAETVTPAGNSCMIVIATDAALDARQLGRLARRAVFALAPVGSHFTHGSGDYAIAFTTAPHAAELASDVGLDGPFRAVMESVEEAVLNSLLTATTTAGYRSRQAVALPHDALVDRLVRAGAMDAGSR
jgi:D-aminopeptidase